MSAGRILVMVRNRAALESELEEARRLGRSAEIVPTDLPSTIEAAYGFQFEASHDVAAWKIGGANPWSRALFENEEVFFGPLQSSETLIETQSLPIGGLVSPLGEPEIMLQIGDPSSSRPFSQIGAGFEIPATVLPDDLKQSLVGQICDRAGAGKLWIAAIAPFNAERCASGIRCEFFHNQHPAPDASTDNVIGTPLGAAHEFLRLAKLYDAPVRPGQWVATGGLCPAVPLMPGDQLRLSIWGQELSVTLTH